jgi:hypothetical protein
MFSSIQHSVFFFAFYFPTSTKMSRKQQIIQMFPIVCYYFQDGSHTDDPEG